METKNFKRGKVSKLLRYPTRQSVGVQEKEPEERESAEFWRNGTQEGIGGEVKEVKMSELAKRRGYGAGDIGGGEVEKL